MTMLNMKKCFVIKPQSILIFPASTVLEKKDPGYLWDLRLYPGFGKPGIPRVYCTGVYLGKNGPTVVLNYAKTTQRNSRLVEPRTNLNCSAFS
jgi:hypothetical protein